MLYKSLAKLILKENDVISVTATYLWGIGYEKPIDGEINSKDEIRENYIVQ